MYTYSFVIYDINILGLKRDLKYYWLSFLKRSIYQIEGGEIKNLLFLHVLVAKGTVVGSKISVNIFPLWK